MTPAINLAKKLKIAHTVHEYAHDPNSDSYGLEAAEKLQVIPERVFKTLIVSMDSGELAVAVIPVASMLSMKLVAKAVGAKKAVMASQSDAERSTGYVLGGISPMGQRKKLKTIIHISAQVYPTIYVSAGRRGLEIELSPEDLRKSVNGIYAEICQQP
ncbi:Cys-tRNA(Pro) deacylase [Kaarinaea lacus]